MVLFFSVLKNYRCSKDHQARIDTKYIGLETSKDNLLNSDFSGHIV